MLRKLLLNWFFCSFIIMLQIYTLQAADATQNQETIDKDSPETVDWSGLLSDLRGSWQSPLSYLEKRGYLPAGNENLLEEKLNELRGMKSEGFGNIEEEASIHSASSYTMPEPDKLNQKAQVANEILDAGVSRAAVAEPRGASAAISETGSSNSAISETGASNSAISETIVSNSALSEAGASNSAISETGEPNSGISDTSDPNSAISETGTSDSAASLGPGAPTATFTATNNNPAEVAGVIVKVESDPQQQHDGNAPIVTYASRQHLTDEEQEDLFKGLTIPMNADVDKEIDLEPEEDLDSYKNDKGKATGSAQTKSKKKKCKSKSKSKSKTKGGGEKQGFLQRIKNTFSSLFTKSDKVAEAKKTPEKHKLALSPDFASYYVRYLAHRGDSYQPETPSLTVNDLQGQYTSVVRDYGDWETGGTGKGLYRREFSGKDLTFKDYKSKDPLLSSESNAEDVDAGSKDFESPELDKSGGGAKDLTLREFPFKDFNFANMDEKKLQTKETRSGGTENFGNSDVKKLQTKDTSMEGTSDFGNTKYANSEATEDLKLSDFHFGNIDLKKLQTKSTEDLRTTDLKKFDAKDDDLNKIVQSLGVEGDEATLGTKGLKELKNEKPTTTNDDFTLKGLSSIKEAANTALEEGLRTLKNVKFANGNDGFAYKAITTTKDTAVTDPLDDSDDIMQKDLKDLRKLTSSLDDGKSGEKSGETEPAGADAKDELSTPKKLGGGPPGELSALTDFPKSSFNTKDWGDTSAKDLRINLKDFDFNAPDLGIKGLTAHMKAAASPSGTNKFGDLGMPNAKIKALEASAQAYASSYPTTSNNENTQINESTLPGGFSLRIRDFGVNDALTKETDYVRQELDEYNNNNREGIQEEEEQGGEAKEANHVAAKEAKFNDFDLSSLSTRSDDAGLALDRQFTRQVLEKVMRDSAQNNEHDKESRATLEHY